jgi:hypothetical protein
VDLPLGWTFFTHAGQNVSASTLFCLCVAVFHKEASTLIVERSMKPSPANKPVTLRTVAEHAAVSISAVSLALRNHPSIPETTRPPSRWIPA